MQRVTFLIAETCSYVIEGEMNREHITLNMAPNETFERGKVYTAIDNSEDNAGKILNNVKELKS